MDQQEPIDLMVDFETLDTSENAALLSVGLTVFERHTGNKKKSFEFNFDLTEQIYKGRVVNPRTVEWWRRTDRTKFLELLSPHPGDCTEAEFTDQLYDLFRVYDIQKVWSRGCMDFHILQRFHEIPYYKFADVRTLDTLVGKMEYENNHDALDDCRNQVAHVAKAMGVARHGLM